MTTTLRTALFSVLVLGLLGVASPAQAAPRPGSTAKNAPLSGRQMGSARPTVNINFPINVRTRVGYPRMAPAAAPTYMAPPMYANPEPLYSVPNNTVPSYSAGNMNYGYAAPSIDDVTISKCARLGFTGDVLPGGGFQVTAVEANGPGEEAGFQVGDVITAANGIQVQTFDDALRAVRTARSTMVFDVIDTNTGTAVRRWLKF